MSQQGSGSGGCLGCLGLLIVLALIAWPIDTLGHAVGWSSTTKGGLELAWLIILVARPARLRRPVRPPAPAVRLAPSRRPELPSAPQTTRTQSPSARRDPIPAQLRFKVLQRDGFRCQYCGRTARDDGVVLHADHVVPVVAGGETNEGNLLTACAACNLGKSARAVLP